MFTFGVGFVQISMMNETVHGFEITNHSLSTLHLHSKLLYIFFLFGNYRSCRCYRCESLKWYIITLQFPNATRPVRQCVVACCHTTWLGRRQPWTGCRLRRCYRKWSICLLLIAVSGPDSSCALYWSLSATRPRFRPRCLALAFARVRIMRVRTFKPCIYKNI